MSAQDSDEGANDAPKSEEARDPLGSLLERGYRYAYSLVHEASAAEDLVQEACVRISRRGGPWSPTYLFTVVRNAFLDQYRRSQKIRFQPLEGITAESGEDDAHADAEAPEVGARLEAADELEQALLELRADERELLYLAVVEGYSASEIARLTGRPRGTILSAVHRAKQKLRRDLGEAAEAGARDAS